MTYLITKSNPPTILGYAIKLTEHTLHAVVGDETQQPGKVKFFLLFCKQPGHQWVFSDVPQLAKVQGEVGECSVLLLLTAQS